MRNAILFALVTIGGLGFQVGSGAIGAQPRDSEESGGAPPIGADRDEISDSDGGPYVALVMGEAGLVEVPYFKVGDDAVTGGDILLGTHAEVQAYTRDQMQRLIRGLDSARGPVPQLRSSQTRSDSGTIGLSGWGGGNTWPRRTIVFRIGSSIPTGDARRTRIAEAVGDWNSSTSLHFKPFAQATQAEKDRGVLVFIDSPKADNKFSCYSWVGFKGWHEQSLKINPSCSRGNIRHEMGHAVGLHHEHQRTDRATLITVHSIPNLDNYGKISGEHLSSYDLCSMMHYSRGNPAWFSLKQAGKTAFAACKMQLPAGCRYIGQRCWFSTLDVASINRLYEDIPA